MIKVNKVFIHLNFIYLIKIKY